MPYLIELFDSREVTNAREPDQRGITLKFLAVDALDEGVVAALVASNCPGFFLGLRFNNYRTSPKGAGIFEVSVNYGTSAGGAGGGGGSKPTGFLTLNFDTGEDKQKLTVAFAQRTYPIPGRTAVNYRGAIGIKRENGQVKAEGIDVQRQSFGFTVSRTFNADGALTGDLVGLLISDSWFVNDDQIDVTILGVDLHFAPGELLFKGATGSQKAGGISLEDGDATWEGEVTLKFGCSRNLVGITHPSGATNVTKLGWEYAETIYTEDVDQKTFVPKPIQVNVNQVFPTASLGILFQ